MSKIYNLESGIKVSWKKDSYFENYHLKIIDSTPNDGCGNPWGMMTSLESEIIEKERPEMNHIPCGIKSIMKHKIISYEDLSNELIDDISSDCWGVFSTTEDRKEIVNIYFDDRKERELIDKENKFKEERDRLIKNPQDLINEINNGNTICIVLGIRDFMEIYYCKLSDIYLQITVDHSILW